MFTLIDLVYHSHHEFNSPEEVLKKHAPSLGYIDHLKNNINIEVIRHMNRETSMTKDNVVYRFFKRKNTVWQNRLSASSLAPAAPPLRKNTRRATTFARSNS